VLSLVLSDLGVLLLLLLPTHGALLLPTHGALLHL
jgi:hypothetical protein